MSEIPKIVLIEDDPATCEMVRMMLTSLDVHFAYAHNAQDGWELIQEVVPDLILVDLRLPDVNGLELANHIWEQYGEYPVVLIAVSATTTFSRAEIDVLQNFDAFLDKPFQKNQFLSLIQKFLDSRV